MTNKVIPPSFKTNFAVLLLLTFGVSTQGFGQCSNPTTLDDSRCGAGSVTLQANGSTGKYLWYDSPALNNLVGKGGNFFNTLHLFQYHLLCCCL